MNTPAEIAKRLRPNLTRLYLLYFRQSAHSEISTAQLSIMMNLENGPMRISQIAAVEAIRMPTASNAINQLENMGIVTRIRDISDRRGVQVKLTKRGHELLKQIGEERDAQLARMLEKLSPEEMKLADELSPMIEIILTRYKELIEEDVQAIQPPRRGIPLI